MLDGVTGSTAAAQATIKREVLRHLGEQWYYKGKPIVAQFSDQTIALRDGAWSFAYIETKLG